MSELIRVESGHNRYYVEKSCLSCGKPLTVRSDSHAVRCKSCAISYSHSGSKHRLWKGGQYKSPRGYIMIYLNQNDPFVSMANQADHYVSEHRLVMAKHLGRPLTNDELVHHINGVKDDNRIVNLSLFSGECRDSIHAKWHWDNTRRENVCLCQN